MAQCKQPAFPPEVRILVVDDEELLVEHICRVLSSAGWKGITRVHSGAEALASLKSDDYALCICDLRMPEMDGLQVLRLARKAHVRTDFLILTGYGTIETAVEATRLGAVNYLTKPIRPVELITAVWRVLRWHLAASHSLAARMDTLLADRSSESGLRVDDLCRAFNVSRRQVSRLFREHLRDTFPARLAYHRTVHAKQLLTEPNRPLTEVAAACGFRSYRRMQEAFAKLVGMGPAQYRELLVE